MSYLAVYESLHENKFINERHSDSGKTFDPALPRSARYCAPARSAAPPRATRAAEQRAD